MIISKLSRIKSEENSPRLQIYLRRRNKGSISKTKPCKELIRRMRNCSLTK